MISPRPPSTPCTSVKASPNAAIIITSQKTAAHVKGHNSESIGIAYEGGLNASGKATDTRTTAQKQSLETLLRFLLLTYPGAKVCGHRDLSPDLNHNGIIEPCEYIKECPCFNVRTEYGYLMENGKWRMDNVPCGI